MCYSALVAADYRQILKRYPQAQIDFGEFLDLFQRRSAGESLILPKGLTDPFRFGTPQSDLEEQCRTVLTEWETDQGARLHELMNAQQVRLAGAEEKLASKPTKKAAEDKRIATNRIADLQQKIDDLERTDPKPRDSRIFAYSYCPVMTMEEDGQLVVRPMRYLCRLPGMAAKFDVELKGNYNARRDNLGKFWRRLFTNTRGIVLVSSFFEHVALHAAQQRELAPGEERQGAVLRFTPDHAKLLPMATVWSHWTGLNGEHDLLSFAIITDEPYPEVLRVGHDRTPVALDEDKVMPWLSKSPERDLPVLDALLEVHDRPFYACEMV